VIKRSSDPALRSLPAGVLLVDDNPSNLLALEAVLSPLAVRTVQARSGPEALEHVAKGPFAVALIDVQMPGMDGFELTRRIRATEHGRELPVVFVTAIYRDEQYIKRGYASGAADYITKPYDPDVIRARVKAFVDLYEQREKVRRGQVALRTQERDEALRRLVAMERIATAALETTDLKALLAELLQAFTDAADNGDFATILLRDGDFLRVEASVGFGEKATGGGYRVRIGQGFAGTIAALRKPLEISGKLSPKLLPGDGEGEESAAGLYGVPLQHGGELLGVAYIGSRRETTFSAAEKRVFDAAAERAALAVGRHLEQSRLNEVLSEAPAWIAIVGVPAYEYEFVNPPYAALFEGRKLVASKFSTSDLGPEVFAALERVHSQGTTVQLPELRLPDTGQGVCYARITLQPLRNASGTLDRVLLFAVDVTQQVRARQEIEATQAARAELLERERAARRAAELANTAKDEFLATVSHELRTPLNAILGWAAMIRTKATGEVERALGIIERNARAQARIVEDVLDFSRIARGKMRLLLGSVELTRVVEEALEAVRPAADAKGVKIGVDLSFERTVYGDAERLQQVVWNLLSNAVKFTSAGGYVRVQGSSSRSLAKISISDSGQGIEPEFVPHVFEPFRQANGSTTRRHGGLGLGLSIVRQIVHAHGGSISAESDGLGRGATFTVELPLESPALRPSEPPSLTPPGRPASVGLTLGGLKVLVVEDEEDSRELLVQAMVIRGAEVVSAGSVVEAVREFERFGPDVLVSDIAMPDADGYDLIRHVRKLPAERGGLTPAVAVTAHAQRSALEQALNAGFQRYVPKPVDVEELVATIADLKEDSGAAGAVPEPR
jgi:signal transduction histidine kinase/DNA-binding response OmpR family regulator